MGLIPDLARLLSDRGTPLCCGWRVAVLRAKCGPEPAQRVGGVRFGSVAARPFVGGLGGRRWADHVRVHGQLKATGRRHGDQRPRPARPAAVQQVATKLCLFGSQIQGDLIGAVQWRIYATSCHCTLDLSASSRLPLGRFGDVAHRRCTYERSSNSSAVPFWPVHFAPPFRMDRSPCLVLVRRG